MIRPTSCGDTYPHRLIGFEGKDTYNWSSVDPKTHFEGSYSSWLRRALDVRGSLIESCAACGP